MSDNVEQFPHYKLLQVIEVYKRAANQAKARNFDEGQLETLTAMLLANLLYQRTGHMQANAWKRRGIEKDTAARVLQEAREMLEQNLLKDIGGGADAG